MNTTPYQNIGDANKDFAFLTGPDGHDKASLLRRTLHSYEKQEEVNVLSDDEWQRMIYLIDAAPKLLNVVATVLPWLEVDREINQEHMSPHDLTILDKAIADARMALDLATVGNRIALSDVAAFVKAQREAK